MEPCWVVGQLWSYADRKPPNPFRGSFLGLSAQRWIERRAGPGEGLGVWTGNCSDDLQM